MLNFLFLKSFETIFVFINVTEPTIFSAKQTFFSLKLCETIFVLINLTKQTFFLAFRTIGFGGEGVIISSPMPIFFFIWQDLFLRKTVFKLNLTKLFFLLVNEHYFFFWPIIFLVVSIIWSAKVQLLAERLNITR